MTEGTRPNAKYKLSRENPNSMEEEKLTFYYNRQHRLEKASDNVKRLYNEPMHKFSILRPLVADKARASIFFTIIIMCVVIVMLSLMGFTGKTYSLDGNKLAVSAAIIEDVTIIVLKKTIDSKEPYIGVVNIGVSPVTQEEEYPIFNHRIDFSLQEEERYSFTTPFNAPRLAMVLQTEKSTLKVTIKPE